MRFGLVKLVWWKPRLQEESTFHDAYVGSVTERTVSEGTATVTGGGGGTGGPGVIPPETIVSLAGPGASLAFA